MASTYENDLRLEEMATGENSGSWGTKTNTNLELVADAFSYGTEIITDADTPITIADGAADAARSLALKITSSEDLTTTRLITLGPNTTSKVWIIENSTSGGEALTISAGSGSNITLANGKTKIIATDGIGAGSNVVELTQDLAIADLFVDDDLTVGDDIIMNSDGAKIDFGSDSEIQLTHVADTGLLLTETGGGAPTLQFRDSALAISSSADGQLDIDSDGTIDINATTSIAFDTDTLFVDSTNDRVGINTASPAFPLDLSTNSSTTNDAVTALRLSVNTTGTAANNFGATINFSGEDASGSLRDLSTINAIYTDATNRSSALTFKTRENLGTLTEALRIDQSQRVLIGTTSTRSTYKHTVANTSAVSRILGIANGGVDALHFDQARGSVASPTASNADGDGSYISFSSYDGTNWDDIGSVAVLTDGAQNAGRMIFRTTPTGGSQTERMRINQDGDISIGTAADPSVRLDLKYSEATNYGIKVTNTNTTITAKSGITMPVSNGTGGGAIYVNSAVLGGNGNLYDMHLETFQGASSIVFEPSGTEAMRLSSAGDMELIQGKNLYWKHTGGGTIRAGITANSADNLAFSTGSSDSTAMTIDGSQRVLMGAGTNATSTITDGWWNGSSSYSGILNVQNVNDGSAQKYVSLAVSRHSNDAEAGQLGFAKSRGAAANSKTTVGNGDNLGLITFQGADGSNYVEAARITGATDSTAAADEMPGRLQFFTTPIGLASSVERMRITNEGVIAIRDATPFVNVPVNIGGMTSENALGGPTAGTETLNGARISLYAGNQDHQLYMGDNGWEMCGNSISRFAYKSGTNSNNGDAVAAIKWGITGTGRFLFGTETDLAGDQSSALGIVQSDGGARVAFRGTASASGGNVSMMIMSNTSYANTGGGLHYLGCRRSNSSAWTFSGFYSSCNGSGADKEFNFRGDGNGYADGSWNGGGADYAEYFEWSDGNSSAEDRRGMTVALVENKIRVATSDDPTSSIIGVVSAAPVVVGDAAWNHWSERYLRDEFGSYQRETYTLTEWDGEVMRTETNPDGSEYQKLRTERLSYHTDQIPSDVTPPSDAEVVSLDFKGNTLTRRVHNPDYDPTRTYVPREERPEWDAVGMVGKLRIRVGQPIGDRWIKLRDISSGVEEWLIR